MNPIPRDAGRGRTRHPIPVRRVSGSASALALALALALTLVLVAGPPAAPAPAAPQPPSPSSPARSPRSAVASSPVFVSQVTAVDPSRSTPPRGSVPGHQGRTLVTTIYRPAHPGAWPLVMWAHGWNVDPAFNTVLLEALASAGFVVAAPAFPGSASGYPGPASHDDIGNQAIDLGFLVGWLQAHAPDGIDFSAVGAAGHSDGGSTVAALALNDRYQDHRFRAFAVLSGVMSWRIAGSFGARNTAPLLAMAGTRDEYGDYPATRAVYATAASPRAWISIGGASHTSAYFGSGAQADATRAAIADFFALQLRPLGAEIDRFFFDAQRQGLTLTLPDGDPILQRWNVFGGVYGPLGRLLSGPGSDGRGGRIARFANGAVVQSGYGVREVHGAIWRSWSDHGEVGGFLGEPSSDETTAAGGLGRFSSFAGGAVYWSPFTGAHELHGTLLFVWAALGAERGMLGFPTTDGRSVGDGRGISQEFLGGGIWGTSATGYRAVPGAFELVWLGAGGPRGRLGYPVTDPWSASGATIVGFEHGAVYRSAYGVHALDGPIYDTYVAMGSVSSKLGVPTQDIVDDGARRTARFLHGFISWRRSTGTVTVAVGPDHRPR
ncbi:MAG: hypothetical protein JWM05_2858 [Acidimicrobiales bacterium]|nr:hypothetical protein [Acidimicrobiales bacterium]